MHEMSIANMLLEIVLDEARKHAITRIDRILIQVGEMAAVNPDALNFCFSLISEETPAKGAKLEIEIVPVVARCSRCGLIFQVENFSFLCPDCKAITTECISGQELTVLSVEGFKENENG